MLRRSFLTIKKFEFLIGSSAIFGDLVVLVLTGKNHERKGRKEQPFGL
jgi:hypothetical protein